VPRGVPTGSTVVPIGCLSRAGRWVCSVGRNWALAVPKCGLSTSDRGRGTPGAGHSEGLSKSLSGRFNNVSTLDRTYVILSFFCPKVPACNRTACVHALMRSRVAAAAPRAWQLSYITPKVRYYQVAITTLRATLVRRYRPIPCVFERAEMQTMFASTSSKLTLAGTRTVRAPQAARVPVARRSRWWEQLCCCQRTQLPTASVLSAALLARSTLGARGDLPYFAGNRRDGVASLLDSLWTRC
jgi:hypothetical protein